MDSLKNAFKVGFSKIINMFVKNIEPCTFTANPVETRHFDVNHRTLCNVTKLKQKLDGIGDMLQHMAQNNPVRPCREPWAIEGLIYCSIASFVSRIETTYLEATRCQIFQKKPLSAPYLDKPHSCAVALDDLSDLVQMFDEGS